MTVQIELEDDEELVLRTALDNHESGLKEAKEQTTLDPNIDDPDLLCELVGQLDHDLGCVDLIKRRLDGRPDSG